MRNKGNVGIDYRSVSVVAGYLLVVEFAMLIIPAVVSICYGEETWTCFMPALFAAFGGGVLLILAGGGHKRTIHLGRRESYLLTSGIWVLYSLVGMLPFMFYIYPLNAVDAFFETISGFTTTGATVYGDVERLSHGVLLWRSMLQWIGGLGIVIFMLAVLPSLNQEGGVPMYNAETTGIVHDKLHPRIRQTAKSLWTLYLGLTIVLILLLWLGPMSLFDAVCQALTTISTGGFSTRNASIAAWQSDYTAWIISIFMLIGGVNFMLLYGVLRGDVKALLRNDVFRTFVGIVLTAWAAMAAILLLNDSTISISDALLWPLFQVASTITTTGFSYGPYETWGPAVLIIIICLMFVGACAGSTTGAVKVDRFVALWKNMINEIEITLFPHHLKGVTVNGRTLTSAQLSKISAFFMIYIILTVIGALVMADYGYSFTDSFFASASCIGNNGLGYGATGAGGGFGTLPDVVKLVFSLSMLIGRLEIFTVVVLASRKFWVR